MKYLLLPVLFFAINVNAQKQKVQFYIFNKDWSAAKDVQSAAYIVQSTNFGDTIFVNRIFNGTGHLWRQESFKDKELSIAHGAFAWYDDEGRIDSLGYVNNKKKTGSWCYYDDTLGIYKIVQYRDGKEVERRDYIKKTIKTGDSEISFDEEKKQKDSLRALTFTKSEKEAVFKGGPEGYKKYLLKHLDPPTDIVKTGTVKLQFIINKNGQIEDLHILKSLQLSADIEALRVLSEMPEWTPAYQDGKNVFYQAIQSITFQSN